MPASGKGVAWHLAYYISRDTPPKPSVEIIPRSFFADNAGTTEEEHPRDAETNEYDKLMDGNVPDDVAIDDNQAPWGGNTFSGTDPFAATPGEADGA
jgi:hypothetical protein